MILIKRKNLIQSLLIGITGLLIFSSCNKKTTSTMLKEKSTKKSEIIIGLNAYSFNDLLLAKDPRDKEQVYSLFNLLEWCHSQGIKAIDPTAYFFPTYPEVPSDDYLQKLKNRAAELDIIISGTGIRNNFASPDPKVRAEGVELAKKWIVVASKLNAPVLRCFAGEVPKEYADKWEEVASWAIESYKELIPFAKQYNVKIGIQNHGDMLQTAEQCLYVLKGVNSEWAGIIVDTGNFTTADPYEDIKILVPYAVNWQVKEFIDGYGGKVKTDYGKLLGIIKGGGFKGVVPVETLKVRGEYYDPFDRVKNMLDQLNLALLKI